MDKDNRPPDLLDWLGVRTVPNWAVARHLGGLLSVVLLLLFALAVASAFALLLGTVFGGSEGGAGGLGTGALVVALLGAPFLIWSTIIKHRTLALSETALFNDKISAAVEGLYSRRQVTRVITADGEEKILTEWQDDIVQRNGAIDRLEGLARERPSEAPRIANMLSVYVRELSKESEPKSHPRQAWAELVDPMSGDAGMDEDEARAQLGLSPDEISIESLRDWARGLRPFRTDEEKATQTLGRLLDIPGIDPDDVTIDLRGANMQGFDLNGLNFANAKMNDARMEGVHLSHARMTGANLSGAWMEGANLLAVAMEEANLVRARMEGSDLTLACMKKAFLFGARLEGADLKSSGMEGAILSKARIVRADLSGVAMEGASLSNARMEGADLRGAGMQDVFLFGAQMEAVDLSIAEFDLSTDWTAAWLGKAAVSYVDFNKTPISADQVRSTFGDGSTKLPKTIPRPAHWPKAELDLLAFQTELAKWRADPDGYTPPEP